MKKIEILQKDTEALLLCILSFITFLLCFFECFSARNVFEFFRTWWTIPVGMGAFEVMRILFLYCSLIEKILNSYKAKERNQITVPPLKGWLSFYFNASRAADIAVTMLIEKNPDLEDQVQSSKEDGNIIILIR